MTKQLQAEVEVQASAERVWEVLTDFAAYPQWNPFIVKASGEPVPGTRLELHMRLVGRRTTVLRPAGAGRRPRPHLPLARPAPGARPVRRRAPLHHPARRLRAGSA